jgi:hypothetical protein
MQLLSQYKNTETEKKAMAGRIGNAMKQLSKGDDFLSGLAGPVVNFYGGLKRLAGYGKQLPAIYKDPNAAKSVLMKDPNFARGIKDVRRGAMLRSRAGIENIFNPNKSVGYRVGRGVGAVGIGAPIALAPFTVASYLGAGSADPQLAQEYAKNVAYERMRERLNQFSEMPFLDRIQTAWNPEKFTEKLRSPEAADLYENMSTNNINNPGIMKYLTGFNPFISSPNDVITQKVRSEVLRNMQGNKSASFVTKQANPLQQLFTKVLQPAYAMGKQFRGLSAGTKLPKSIRSFTGTPGQSYLEGLAGRYAMNLGKNPILTPLATAGAAYLPFGIYGSYQGGKNQVYEDAARTAEGLADLGFMEKFNQPGFMSGVNRFGMAIAPGLGKDLILNQIRQSMFPEVNQPQY